MADEDEGQDEAPPAREPFGGKGAPLFKAKSKGKKFFDNHKLAVISVLIGVVGLYFVFRNRSSSTAGSTSSNVSGQSTPASNNPGLATSSDPSSMQPWWYGDAGGGGGTLPPPSNPGPPQTGGGTPPKKKASAPASHGAAKPQPSSHPPSSEPKSSAAPSIAAPATLNRAGTLAGLYAPISPSSSPLHSVTPTDHPASHVAVGTSFANGSAVVVPFTYRAGTPAPTAHLTAHAAAPAKRPAGRRIAGRR